MLSLTVAICSKGRPDELRHLVAVLLPLLGTYGGISEVVVVEDVSELPAPVPEIPGVNYLAMAESHGFGLMRQKCVELARGELLLFIDDDCIPCDGWLEALLAPFEDAEVSAVGGGFIPQPGNPVAMAVALLGLPGGGFPRLCRLHGEVETTRDLSNGNLALRASAVTEIGGYRVDLASGGEDSDLIARLSGKTIYVPNALVAHRNRDGWLGIWGWFYRRGKAAAAFAAADRARARVFPWRKSALLKLGLLAIAVSILSMPLFLALSGGYYLFNVSRIARSNRVVLAHSGAETMRQAATGLPPLLIAPLLRLWMDAAYEMAYRHGRLSNAGK